ncbi:MAG TPA: ubiquitin-like domain-containing protein [Jatrophihabitans sp.]|nr:ubiquitin-like domain-containing protein [Jatrophihabitans sp.]
MLRSMKYGLYGAVLAGLVAAPVVWNTVDKSVDLVVDGSSHTVQTTASDVGQVVHGQGYRLTRHDLLAPSASSPVKDGTRIVLRRGRLLHLDVNGQQTDVWTTAPTVADALAQLGYSTSDFVSVSRAQRLPLGVTDIAIRTPLLITVVHDGQTEQVTTTDATVAQLLNDLNIPLGSSDRLSAAPDSALVPGETIRVQRVATKTVTRMKTLPFSTTRKSDPSLTKGTTEVVTPGRDGKVRIVYSIVYVDGKAVGQTTLSSVVLARPRTQVVKVGTKDVPAPVTVAAAPTAPAPSPGTAKAIAKQMLTARGWGTDQYDCLVTLWNNESGWRVNATNSSSGAYGIPQALPGSKMGPGWQTDATVQIRWGLGYIASRYGTPCGAWSYWQANGWY